MSAVTRWVQYDIGAMGEATDGSTGCRGTRGSSISTSTSVDSFTIGSTTDKLYLSLDNESAPYITIASGVDLDPRFVAKDITEKLHDLGKGTNRWDNAVCRWENNKSTGSCFKISSGTLGPASSVTVTSGVNSCNNTLGYGDPLEPGGLDRPAHNIPYGFDGTITVSGTYGGKFDEVYKIVMSNDSFSEAVTAPRGIATPSKDPANSYSGTFTTGGAFNASTNLTYTIAINTTNGTTVGAGIGNVPTMSWASTGSDDSTQSVDILYSDYWYKVGDWGLSVKFTDAVFNTASPAWTVSCYSPDYVQGTNSAAAVELAQYVWASDRGDFSDVPITTASGSFTRLGTRGLNIKFNPTNGSDNFSAGDEFYVMCSAPKPSAYDIVGLNYGNVTVSTESSLKNVMFEIYAGAVNMSTVKFGLQAHGTFVHHDQNNNDTKFRFGTVGVANKAGTIPENGIEWVQDVLASDIDSDSNPDYLYYTREDLIVAATADDSETLGSYGLVSDGIWLNIKLGSAETGANSSINYRLYFDFS